jgi:phage baseplate assembly protein W
MIVIRASDKLPLSLAPKNESEARIQQLYILISTIQGECPLYRDFGVSHDYLHMPINMAKTAYTLAITEAFRKYAPDVTLENIRFETTRGMEGILSPVLEVSDI